MPPNGSFQSGDCENGRAPRGNAGEKQANCTSAGETWTACYTVQKQKSAVGQNDPETAKVCGAGRGASHVLKHDPCGVL